VTAGAVPERVLAAYGWQDADLAPLTGGLINQTFAVGGAAARRGVLQRLHPIFGAEVNLDLEAVTAHLAAVGLPTPRLIRTTAGEPWVAADGGVWRALTWVEGECFARAPSPAHIRAAGELVGRFHRALSDFTRPFGFVRAGVHDTAGHLARLRAGAAAPAVAGEPSELAEARALATDLLAHAAALPPLGEPPRRNAHGDLKLSNVMFAPGRAEGLCLVDLDTMGQMLLAHELGDALRSWSNPAGEDVTSARVDLALVAAALEGYGASARAMLAPGEAATIAAGFETVTLEVGVRFCADVFEDRYFGWDAARYPSRRAHNLVRARGQASLAASIRAERAAIGDLVARHLG
jgi:Ser/Thr protein kinase RdoA (MazF antagonist)